MENFTSLLSHIKGEAKHKKRYFFRMSQFEFEPLLPKIRECVREGEDTECGSEIKIWSYLKQPTICTISNNYNVFITVEPNAPDTENKRKTFSSVSTI